MRGSITPDSFFQLNTLQAQKMFETIIAHGNFKKDEVVLDAYAGVGTIGSFISPYVKEVISVERVKSAVNANKRSNKINKVTNHRPITGEVINVVKVLKTKVTTMVFDPPREGLKKELLNFILKEEPKKIVYASCNPETLGTDLKVLSKKYKIEKVIPLDMFPQTSHTESITFLIKK